MILLTLCLGLATPAVEERPHFLLCIADDWGWPHASAYGDPVVQTPSFDRLADEGVLFRRAFVSSPSCTPSRAALLTGQDFWRLEESANLWSTLRAEFPTYPELLEQAGYHVGFTRKGWGPGKLEPGGREGNPAGRSHRDFAQFLAQRPEGAPFCFWFGAHDPHRGYRPGSGEEAGIDPARIRLPACFPDAPEVRSDVADYYFEVQRFDREVGELLALLEAEGELERTVVVMTGDHGMPFPRCKTNLYDSGARVGLALRWGEQVDAGRVLTDFVSLTDLAPTFLELAGVPVPEVMTGRSLVPLLRATASGRIEAGRDHVVFGRERHVPAQLAPSQAGYPARALRTERWLYIRNFEPERWPSGVPEGSPHRIRHFSDCDDGPTKSYLLEHRDDPAVRPFHDLAFARRPAQELYDLARDPDQLDDVADDPRHQDILNQLDEQLMTALRDRADPRVIGGAERLEAYPYYGGVRKK